MTPVTTVMMQDAVSGVEVLIIAVQNEWSVFMHANQPKLSKVVSLHADQKQSLLSLSLFLRQIGRSTESPIDFVVTDTVAGSQSNADTQSVQSTISRFACRIKCQRTPPYTARIYAAGFDSSKNIFLGVRRRYRCLYSECESAKR